MSNFPSPLRHFWALSEGTVHSQNNFLPHLLQLPPELPHTAEPGCEERTNSTQIVLENAIRSLEHEIAVVLAVPLSPYTNPAALPPLNLRCLDQSNLSSES